MSDEAVTTQPKPRAPLISPRLQEAEYERRVFVATPEAGTKLEEMLSPGYWAHVAPRLTPWSRIEVRAEDGAFYAEMLVLSCERNWAKMFVLNKYDLIPADLMMMPSASDEFKIEFAGPHHKWRVVRLSDKEVLRTGYQTKEEANTWLNGHIKTVG